MVSLRLAPRLALAIQGRKNQLAPRRKPGFIVHAPMEVAEEAFHDPSASTLVGRYADALAVADLGIVIDGTGDREDWIEQACRVVSCLDAAAPVDVPVWAADRATSRLLPLCQAAALADPLGHDLVVWGLFDPVLALRLAERGAKVSDPFGVPPRYGTNPAFLANAGRRFVTCVAEASDHPGGPPPIGDVLRGFLGTPVVHKVLGGRAKEYPVRRFVPTSREIMPEDVALCVVHRSGDLHAIQEHVPMWYEYRVMVVDGVVVTGAGSVMEHTPLDRSAGMGVFAPWARRDIRGKDAPETPAVVGTYHERAQALVVEILLQPGFPRHFVLDLFTAEAGGVGIVEMNPLNGSGLFANDAWALASAAMRHVMADGREEVRPDVDPARIALTPGGRLQRRMVAAPAA